MSKRKKRTRFAPKLHIKKGDMVKVITGDWKGTEGEVLEVIPSKNRAVVEGVNINKKHQKATQTKEAGIVEMEAPVHISNLMLIDPKSKTASRIGRKMDNGKLVRYSKKSGEIIK